MCCPWWSANLIMLGSRSNCLFPHICLCTLITEIRCLWWYFHSSYFDLTHFPDPGTADMHPSLWAFPMGFGNWTCFLTFAWQALHWLKIQRPWKRFVLSVSVIGERSDAGPIVFLCRYHMDHRPHHHCPCSPCHFTAQTWRIHLRLSCTHTLEKAPLVPTPLSFTAAGSLDSLQPLAPCSLVGTGWSWTLENHILVAVTRVPRSQPSFSSFLNTTEMVVQLSPSVHI